MRDLGAANGSTTTVAAAMINSGGNNGTGGAGGTPHAVSKWHRRTRTNNAFENKLEPTYEMQTQIILPGKTNIAGSDAKRVSEDVFKNERIIDKVRKRISSSNKRRIKMRSTNEAH